MANMEEYFKEIEKNVDKMYEIARACRSKGYDTTETVEISKTADLAERVEGLVGPAGVAPHIRELLKQKSREETCFHIVNEIIEGKYGTFKEKEKIAEQAVRTGVSILTEGVTAAGTEGISKLKLGENSDGTKYLSIYFAGPIRAAGGTSAAYAVMLTDYARKLLGLQTYVPTDTEVERYVEEIGLYQTVLYARQYKLSDEEIRFIVRNSAVCMDGEPTEELEVSIYKRVPRVETSRIRGGMALVATEGFGLKAAKLLKFSRKHNLGWDWLEGLVKIGKRGKVFEAGAKPIDVYLGDIVGGRPIFAYPSVFGGFRLRYGRSRNSGINGRCIHPATMYILEEFPAVGTQFKVEQPGKGTTISPCDTIEPPVVLLKNGDVCIVNSTEKAKELGKQVDKILFLGDILTSYGDFLKSGNPLLPPGFCEEWWGAILKDKKIEILKEIDSTVALEISEKNLVPLHPKYVFFYKNMSKEELFALKKWLDSGSIDEIETLGGKKIQRVVVENASEKQILEKTCIPHKVREGRIIIDDARPLLRVLKNIDEKTEGTALQVINATCGFPVYDKAGTFIGARMGRPEKAKERHMAPAPNGIVPLGEAGGRTRSIAKAIDTEKFVIDMPELICPKCSQRVFGYFCRKCGERAQVSRVCVKCGRRSGKDEKCEYCGEGTLPFSKVAIDFRKEANAAVLRLAEKIPDKAKGVEGVINPDKFFEPLEKCILRAKHGVHVFKDGTIRFDATNVPVTHFRPCEIGTSVEKLQQLGYEADHLGNVLTSENQVVELLPQDILPSEAGLDCFLGIAKYTDDLLEKFYGLPRYYNANKKEDLTGQYVIGIAPHISVGIVGRIIGFTRARVGYAHPYFHCAQRRDCFAHNETFPLYDGKNWNMVRIGEFVEKKLEEKKGILYGSGDVVIQTNGYKTVSFNTETGKYEIKPIVAFSKHVPQNHLAEIHTRNGRKIRTTGTHQFITYNKGYVKKSAHELNKVLLPKKINIPAKDVKTIDLLEIADEDMMLRGAGNLLRKAIEKKGGLKKTSEKLKINKNTLFDYITRDSVPYGIIKKLGITPPQDILIATRRDTVVLRRFIKVDADFLRLVGLFVSEGYARKKDKLNYQVVFCNGKFIKEVERLAKKIFGANTWKGKDEIAICSRIIYKLFMEYLGCGTDAKTKRIPSFVLSLPLDKAKFFLQGYFEGDGGVTKSGKRGLEVHCTSASEMLLKDVEFLLLRYGIPCSWQKDERTMSTGKVAEFYKKRGRVLSWLCWKLRVHGTDAKKFCEDIGFWSTEKNNKGSVLSLKSGAEKRRIEIHDNILNNVKKIEFVKTGEPTYNLTVEGNHNLIMSGILTKQCDGDENSIMFLLDALLNFSKKYLPAKRGGSMDAPLVINIKLDPTEIDDQVHAMETVYEYPLALYESAMKRAGPADVVVDIAQQRLGKETQYYGLGFTHDTARIDDGPTCSRYTQLKTMEEKVNCELELAEKIVAVDKKDMAARILNFHFLRDIYGNLRAYGEQKFRCVECNAKYRRIPLSGKCNKCGGKLLLTVNQGGIKKYLEISKQIAEKYGLGDYLKQRLVLIEKDLAVIFKIKEEPTTQKSLADFI